MKGLFPELEAALFVDWKNPGKMNDHFNIPVRCTLPEFKRFRPILFGPLSLLYHFRHQNTIVKIIEFIPDFIADITININDLFVWKIRFPRIFETQVNFVFGRNIN